MPLQSTFTRYDIIIKKLQKAPSTFNEILNALNHYSNFIESDLAITQRTFQRDIKAIEQQFNIEIKNRKTDNKYFIVENSNEEIINNKLFEIHQINNAINLSKQLDYVVFFEHRQANGIEHFNNLIYAIKNKFLTNFTHHKYYENHPTQRQVKPIALKESIGVWYLLAIDTKDDTLKTFGLDRVSNVEVLKRTFSRKNNINFKSHFANSFGIITKPNTKPSIVQLQFNYEQGMYIQNYPLHHSQSTVKSTKKNIIVVLEIHITYDFVMEVLKYGKEVKVLEPLSLINEIKSILYKNLNQYVSKK